MTLIGLPDTAVQESRDRVQNAVKNAGLHFPRYRVIINLAPATIRKEGSSYDLPITLGVIVLAGFLPNDKDEGQSLMRAAMSQLQLSARACHRILKLSRTIADLAGSNEIQSTHLAETLQYRPKIMA